ncbi:WG repeat-containing protein [Hymenobacter cheonanensis]|uniref:WG repeat-containing protein n=1 Tax=Hymenobacter sp. CA2-7 TaxID=3063993 RepID=UPI00271435C5|nr:WG repeat-containing protein [Hymenobacter sp. CA2-7]MDO7888218.1 WG repeat-containing protein [Hymenobacter sp. CA2-7]
MERVAEPPGGLIPYRAGKLWGYADTTGRVVIRPCWELGSIQQTAFLHQGFALVRAPQAGQQVQWLPGPPPDARTQRSEEAMWLVNARGEFLRVRRSEAAVRQADGSLVCLPRERAHGQWEVIALRAELDERTGFSNWEFRRVRAADDWPAALPDRALHITLLGANRVSWQPNELPPNPDKKAAKAYLLADLRGNRLTDPRFNELGRFREGRAHFSLSDHPLQYGYLDTTGRVAIAARFANGSAFSKGRAVVTTPAGQYGIIDRAGRYLLAPAAHQLIGPDAAGFIAQLVPDSAGAGIFCYLPPPGRAGFAQRRFNSAGPFQHGRAAVQQGTRYGLVNEAGQWVTPLAYDLLVAPTRLAKEPQQTWAEDQPTDETWAADYTPPPVQGQELPWLYPLPTYLRPDTAYLLARRAGHYGVVARHSGREVVPAIYDSVVATMLHGTARFTRAGRPYVVVASTGRAVEGSYQGIDFATPHGRRLYITRAQPAAWALLDTTGQLRTPWVPGTGYPTRQGWLLSREAQTWTLRDSTGRVAYTSATEIEQPASREPWRHLQEVLRGQDWPYWQLPLGPPPPADRAAFFVRDSTTRQVRVLDGRLRLLGVLPPPTSTTRLQLLGSGWAYLVPTTYHPELFQFPPDLPAASLLLTKQGHQLVLPGGMAWAYFPGFDYAQVWQQYGVLPTTQGYRTRGGRKLWE